MKFIVNVLRRGKNINENHINIPKKVSEQLDLDGAKLELIIKDNQIILTKIQDNTIQKITKIEEPNTGPPPSQII